MFPASLVVKPVLGANQNKYRGKKSTLTRSLSLSDGFSGGISTSSSIEILIRSGGRMRYPAF